MQLNIRWKKFPLDSIIQKTEIRPQYTNNWSQGLYFISCTVSLVYISCLQFAFWDHFVFSGL